MLQSNNTYKINHIIQVIQVITIYYIKNIRYIGTERGTLIQVLKVYNIV